MTDYLDIDGLSLEIPQCWHTEDIAPLLSDSDVRGAQDRLVPGDAGVIATPIRETVTVVHLSMLIYGWKNHLGVAHPSVRAGLGINRAKLKASVTTPLDAETITRTATLHVDGLDPVSKPVKVLGLQTAGYGYYALRGVLRLSFTEGLFDLSDWLP